MGQALTRDIQNLSKFKPYRGQKQLEFEQQDSATVHAPPRSVSYYVQNTNFTRKEIKCLYQSFKTTFHTGTMDEAKLKRIFHEIFPNGHSELFTRLIFQTCDRQNKGYITFEEYIGFLSVLCRGSNREKIDWIFSMYDRDRDDVIYPSDVCRVITAVYSLHGKVQLADQCAIREHSEQVFEKLDSIYLGFITRERFTQACVEDPQILNLIAQNNATITARR